MPNPPAKRHPSGLLAELLCLLTLYIWTAFYSYPFFFDSLTNNSREIATYNGDSQLTLDLVNQSLSSQLFEVNFFDYGHLYFNVAIALSYVYSLFFPLDQWTTFFILRLTSYLGTGLTLALVFLFARRFIGRIEAVFAACLFAFSPAAIEWGIEVHPDSWQMFLLTLSVYFCARAVVPAHPADSAVAKPETEARFGFVLAAAAAAGAAFGTKYLGILLFPLLAAAVLMTPVDRRTDLAFARATRWIVLLAGMLAVLLAIAGYETTTPALVGAFPTWAKLDQASLERIAQLIRWTCFLGAGLCGALAAAYPIVKPAVYRAWLIPLARFAAVVVTFCAVFAMTSPWSIYQLQFVPNVVMQSARTGLGDRFGLLWFPFLLGRFDYDGDLVGWETGVLAAAGAGFLLKALLQRDFRGTRPALFFVLGFVIIFITFLVTRVNRVTVNYALPAVPGLVLLAACGLSELRMTATRWLGARTGTVGAVALAAMIAVTQMGHGINILNTYRKLGLIEALAPDNRMLGDWLLRCVSTDAGILAAPYSYVPPQFGRFDMGESLQQLHGLDPDVVIFSKDDMAFFQREAPRLAADPYSDLPSTLGYFDEITQSPKWRMGPNFERYQVYVTSPPRATVRADCL